MVCLAKMSTITDHPFPFPYAQMIATLLVIHWSLTPVLIGCLPVHCVWSFLFSFISVFALCALNLIAQEIENPFGDDPNDLNCAEAQEQMNHALMLLLRPASQTVPDWSSATALHVAKRVSTKRCSEVVPPP